MKTSSIRASKLAFAALLLASAPARAQQKGDPALAEALFREGKALLEAGAYAKACPKLAESQAVDPGTGTLLALAICHEREGKTASAWAEYAEVAAAAKREGRPDREKAARQRVASLEPRLSRLTIVVVGTAAMDVKRDGVTVGPTARGSPTPIDPGSHVIQASASGKKTWSTTLTVAPNRDNVRVEVPELEDEVVPAAPAPAPAPAPTSPPAPAAPPASSSKRLLGLVVAGAGVAAVGAGSYFGVRALSENGDATTRCPSTCRDPQAVGLNSDARAHATVADIAIGAGILAVAIGAFLVVTSGPEAHPSKAARARPLDGVYHW